jgi:hypothetical protein
MRERTDIQTVREGETIVQQKHGKTQRLIDGQMHRKIAFVCVFAERERDIQRARTRERNNN